MQYHAERVNKLVMMFLATMLLLTSVQLAANMQDSEASAVTFLSTLL